MQVDQLYTPTDTLFSKRKRSYTALYISIAFAFAVLGILGSRYGAAIPYFSVSALALSMVAYPTKFAWLLLTIPITIISIVVSIFTFSEVVSMGLNASIASEPIPYILFLSLILGINFILIKALPEPTQISHDSKNEEKVETPRPL